MNRIDEYKARLRSKLEFDDEDAAVLETLAYAIQEIVDDEVEAVHQRYHRMRLDPSLTPEKEVFNFLGKDMRTPTSLTNGVWCEVKSTTEFVLSYGIRSIHWTRITDESWWVTVDNVFSSSLPLDRAMVQASFLILLNDTDPEEGFTV